jgi:hypothetical protein
MARLGRADEIVVGAIEPRHHVLEAGGVAVSQLAGAEPLRARRLQHLDAVLVGAGQKEDVVAVQPLEAGNGIGRDRLIGMADMGRAVGIAVVM